MLFACLTAPTSGGATAVADAPTVLDALPAELVQRFEREGWLLTRSYNDEIGASFAEAFGTDDRGAVESYCRANAIEFEWQPDGGAAHPAAPQRRGAPPRHRPALLVQPDRVPQRVDDRPRRCASTSSTSTATTGCRSTPASATATRSARTSSQLLNEVYEANTAREPWQAGDLMLVDNIRTRAQPGGVRGTARGARRDGRPGAARRLLADHRGGRAMTDRSVPPTPPSARRRAAQSRAAVRGHLRGPGPARAAGPREADRRAGRGDLPAARRRRLGEPAVVLPALPGPPVVPDHRAARLDRRAGAGRRPEVDLQLPGERGGRHPEGLRRADPQRPRHRLPVRLPGELDHQRHQDRCVGGAGGRLAQPRPAASDARRLLRRRPDRPLHPHLPGRHRLVVRRDRRARPLRRERGRLPRATSSSRTPPAGSPCTTAPSS